MADEIRVCVDRRLNGLPAVQAAEASIAERADNAPPAPDRDLQWDERVRLALEAGKLWQPGRTIRIAFVDGDPDVHARVAEIASEWMKHANVRFEFGDVSPREIRVSFAERASWSWVGTEALKAPLGKPTMNLAGLTADLPDEDYRRVVLHEFGHVLGCIHEHASPAGGIPWKREAVYDYYKRPPYGWSRKKTDANIFAVYKSEQTQFSTFDPKSIMIYPIPKEFTRNACEIGWNTSLSQTDVDFIGSVYRFPDASLKLLECDGPALNGKIGTDGATVSYGFTVTESGRFVLETGGYEDLALEVRRPDDTLAGSDDKLSGDGGSARISLVLKEGDYVANVRHQRATGKGPFSISLKRG